MNYNWISIYIFIKGDVESFLSLLYRKVLSRQANLFFFIRYSEPTFHIRLRVKIRQQTEKRAILDFLKKEQRKISSGFSITQLYQTAYDPELKRYGGVKAIRLAEHFFFVSSKLFLEQIQHTKCWGRPERLGFAFRCAYLFLESTGLTIADKQRLLDATHQGWLNTYLFSHNMICRSDVQDAFEQSLLKEKDHLNEDIARMNSCLKSGNFQFGEEMDLFISAVTEIDAKLMNYILRNEIDVDSISIGNTTQTISILYESYLHMMNNRIGLKNIEESYLAYLLMRLAYPNVN